MARYKVQSYKSRNYWAHKARSTVAESDSLAKAILAMYSEKEENNPWLIVVYDSQTGEKLAYFHSNSEAPRIRIRKMEQLVIDQMRLTAKTLEEEATFGKKETVYLGKVEVEDFSVTDVDGEIEVDCKIRDRIGPTFKEVVKPFNDKIYTVLELLLNTITAATNREIHSIVTHDLFSADRAIWGIKSREFNDELIIECREK